jgi:hypothetical protein
MMRHVVGITATIATFTLCTFLPFLPGRYDNVAVTLSMMFRFVGIVGLLLVPVAAVWLAAEHWPRLAGKRYTFAIAALITASLIWIVISLLMFFESPTLGVAALLLWGYALSRMLPRLSVLRSAGAAASAVPWYLVVVPVAVALIQFVLAGPATEFSRNRAIRNSAPLIADIEQYRTANGRYPPSLVSVWKDYSPSMIGIREYQYEPHGDAYNVLFEQLSFRLGIREIVMYNPRDEQVMTSHAMDVLQLTPAQLALDRTRGHNALHDAGHPHWKYFWYD